jgi:methylmalonyl-CoA mutase, C-terminal domain
MPCAMSLANNMNFTMRSNSRDSKTYERERLNSEGVLLMADTRPIRVLVAKPGLDGHDRGAKVIARALRDAGMEVIYTGIRQTPEMIVEAAIQEDVDAILMSILSGAHMTLFPKVMELLKKEGVDDMLVVAGGILPDEDLPAIKEMGIKGCFGPGTSMEEISEFVRSNIQADRLTTEV